MSGYHYSPERRRARLARRIKLSNGHWFHPDAPTHGTWTGYNYWECRCLVCRDRGRRAKEIGEQRRRHNTLVLAGVIPPSAAEPVLEPPPRLDLPRAPVFTPEPPPPAPPPPPVEPPSAPEPVRIELPPALPEPKPAPKPKPAKTPELTFEWPEDLPVPKLTPGSRERVRDPEHALAIARAVYEPEVVLPNLSGGKRHRHGDVEVVVADNGTVVFVGEREQVNGHSTLLTAAPQAVPKAKGGRGGRRTISSTGDLIDALRKMRIPFERTGGNHWKIHCPDGTFYITSTTASDSRGVQNCVAELRRKGVAL